MGDWKTWGWRVIHAYLLRLIFSFIFKCPFCFVLLVHKVLPTFVALHLDFAAPTRRLAILFLTSNMLVKRYSDFLSLCFLTGVDVIGKPVLSYVIYSGVDTIAESIICFRFCWSSHLSAWWYIYIFFFIQTFLFKRRTVA